MSERYPEIDPCHATMPCDALARFRDLMQETRSYGFAKVRNEQLELGVRVSSARCHAGRRAPPAVGLRPGSCG